MRDTVDTVYDEPEGHPLAYLQPIKIPWEYKCEFMNVRTLYGDKYIPIRQTLKHYEEIVKPEEAYQCFVMLAFAAAILRFVAKDPDRNETEHYLFDPYKKESYRMPGYSGQWLLDLAYDIIIEIWPMRHMLSDIRKFEREKSKKEAKNETKNL